MPDQAGRFRTASATPGYSRILRGAAVTRKHTRMRMSKATLEQTQSILRHDFRMLAHHPVETRRPYTISTAYRRRRQIAQTFHGPAPAYRPFIVQVVGTQASRAGCSVSGSFMRSPQLARWGGLLQGTGRSDTLHQQTFQLCSIRISLLECVEGRPQHRWQSFFYYEFEIRRTAFAGSMHETAISGATETSISSEMNAWRHLPYGRRDMMKK